jgi:hypothetical protein
MRMENYIENYIKELFENYAKRYVELLNKYVAEEQKLKDSHDCDKCEKRKTCDEELERKCNTKLQHMIDELKESLYDEISKLQEDVENRLLKQSLEVEFNVDIDGNCYFNAPAYPRAYKYFYVHEFHHVIDKKAKKCYVVEVSYSELQKPWTTEYTDPCVTIAEGFLIDEDLPFSCALVNAIPWQFMRPIWIHNIEAFVKRIVDAERLGNLAEEVKKVYAEAKRCEWIYDYAHFLGALEKTCEEFNISIP